MANIESDDLSAAQPEIVWLDCTLRDGGYYNSWDFPATVIQDYLYAMSESGVDRVELGFRFPKKSGFLGFSAYTPDSVLRTLEIPSGLHLGVMINCSDLITDTTTLNSALLEIFTSESREYLDFVRIATHLEEIEVASSASRWLKNYGYEVGVNLMQISEASEPDISAATSSLDPEIVDVLYVADSLGTLGPADTAAIITCVKSAWGSDIGIHAHDNGGLATANTLAAIESGANWVDSTIAGMGRGAGNARTEILAGHLDKFRATPVRSELLEQILNAYFLPLQRECGWGVNSHYVRGSTRRIHPTFIQELLSNQTYSTLEIDAAISALGKSESHRYSQQRLASATEWINDVNTGPGIWDQRELFEGKRVLFLGSGPSARDHSAALSQLASDPEVVVVSSNLSAPIDTSLISARVACHPLRIVADASTYSNLTAPVIMPRALLPEDQGVSLASQERILDVGLAVSSGRPSAASTGFIELAAPLVLPYGLLVCLSGGAESVFLAGFDGYTGDDQRRSREQQILDEIIALKYPGQVIAITPTRYEMTQDSVYGLLK